MDQAQVENRKNIIHGQWMIADVPLAGYNISSGLDWSRLIEDYPIHPAVVDLYSHVSAENCGVVRFEPHCWLPYLKADSGAQMTLFHFIEEWDAVTDYGCLQENCPGFSMGEIANAIGFVRGIAQYNTQGINMDALEDERESSAEFQSQILKSLEESVSHVYNCADPNG